MKPVHVGLVADPHSPTQMARRLEGLDPPDGEDTDQWDFEILSEPFATDCEDFETALAHLREHAQEHDWDVVVGLTELPLRDDGGRYLLIETDRPQRAAVLSLPALGGLRRQARARPASSLHWSRPWPPGRSPPSTPRSGCWPEACRRGACWSRRSLRSPWWSRGW
jgi:hypothetical protein